MVAETIDKRRRVGEMRAEAASLGRKGLSTRRREVQSQIAALPSQQPLTEWPSFLEDVCVGDGIVAEDSHSKVTFESLRNLYLVVSRLLKLGLVQYFSFDEP